ncbi:MAG: hypothetical protein Q9201_005320 [Fulgogasparrea decipioides]
MPSKVPRSARKSKRTYKRPDLPSFDVPNGTSLPNTKPLASKTNLSAEVGKQPITQVPPSRASVGDSRDSSRPIKTSNLGRSAKIDPNSGRLTPESDLAAELNACSLAQRGPTPQEINYQIVWLRDIDSNLACPGGEHERIVFRRLPIDREWHIGNLELVNHSIDVYHDGKCIVMALGAYNNLLEELRVTKVLFADPKIKKLGGGTQRMPTVELHGGQKLRMCFAKECDDDGKRMLMIYVCMPSTQVRFVMLAKGNGKPLSEAERFRLGIKDEEWQDGTGNARLGGCPPPSYVF